MTVALETVELGRDWGGLRVLHDVSLTVRASERHAIIVPNGAGKSTLFSMVSGRIRPSRGRILFEGRDVSSLAEHRRARLGISQTFQRSALFDNLSTLDNLTLALARATRHRRFRPAAQRALRARAYEQLGQVELRGRASVPAGQLAHGERRRLELSLALATEPRLLLFDEPAAGLTDPERATFVEIVRQLPAAITVLLVEHDLDVVKALATTVTVLDAGRVIAQGTPEEVGRDGRVREAYLGRRSRLASDMASGVGSPPARTGGPAASAGRRSDGSGGGDAPC